MILPHLWGQCCAHNAPKRQASCLHPKLWQTSLSLLWSDLLPLITPCLETPPTARLPEENCQKNDIVSTLNTLKIRKEPVLYFLDKYYIPPVPTCRNLLPLFHKCLVSCYWSEGCQTAHHKLEQMEGRRLCLLFHGEPCCSSGSDSECKGIIMPSSRLYLWSELKTASKGAQVMVPCSAASWPFFPFDNLNRVSRTGVKHCLAQNVLWVTHYLPGCDK